MLLNKSTGKENLKISPSVIRSALIFLRIEANPECVLSLRTDCHAWIKLKGMFTLSVFTRDELSSMKGSPPPPMSFAVAFKIVMIYIITLWNNLITTLNKKKIITRSVQKERECWNITECQIFDITLL